MACEGKLDSLSELLMGKFPKALGEIFTVKGKGLFPSPKEIDFSCSCPDWAYMCKHVAATLYGIGARLDEDPSLFFKLRKVKVSDLVTQAVEDKTKKLLKKAKKKSARVIDDSDLASVFGIEIETPKTISKTVKSKTAAKKATAKTPAKTFPKRRVATKPAAKTKPVKKAPLKRPAAKMDVRSSAFDEVVKIVRRSRKGITVARIREKTGLDDKQIRIFVYKAKRQGRIKNLERGVYISA